MGLFDVGFDSPQPEEPKPPTPAMPNNGGLPGSGQGAMTGMTNTGVSTSQTPNLSPGVMPQKDAGAGVSDWGAMFNDQNAMYDRSMPTAPDPNAAAPGATAGGGAPTATDLGAFQSQINDSLTKLSAATDPTAHATAKDELSRTLFQTLSTAGHDVKWDNDTLMVDGRPYTVAGGDGPQATPGSMGSGFTPAPPANPRDALMQSLAAPQGQASLNNTLAQGGIADPSLTGNESTWQPTTAPLYTPGEIGFDDIPQFTREGLVGEMEGDPTSMKANSLIDSILSHPESMDAHTTDTMKAKYKDTLAEQQRQEEEDMLGFGSSAGIADSNWLASQRLASRRGRDMGVAKANQDVDIQAAKQNQQDRLNAAGVGLSRQQTHNAAIQAATNASLQKSAITGDRLQLRESVKQEAARLRISQEQVMSNFILEKQRNMIQKYGIDVGAQLDAQKLNQLDAHHREDLMQKMAELDAHMADSAAGRGQSADQFGQRMQFDYDQFNHQLDNDEWEHQYKETQDT